jgi:uncharacterized protein YdhG (YjbR/CyaY superfamily)
MAAPTSVDAYLAALPVDRRAAMAALRQTISAAAPEATQTISYQMPTFRSHGQFLVSFAAFKKHYSLFPASEAVVQALGDDLTPYLAGEGTIRFSSDEQIPLPLVTRIVQVRVAENAARERDKSKKRGGDGAA